VQHTLSALKHISTYNYFTQSLIMSESASTVKPAATKKAAASAATGEKKVIKKKNPNAKSVSRSGRASIIFPVSRIERLLREGRYTARVESTAPVYLAAVLEYLVIEILELAFNTCEQGGKTRITPQHINHAVGNDAELNTVFSKVIIAQGGVIPSTTHFPTSKKKSTKSSS
ncbi:hypothetical protein SAMD00019534_055800, partial [Acytostelium subglobosum LB1]|uniref:hypothetical protein n=1 Tax=Acytostelium subglobosum LB1 TaxID=1410327 RepID=UPI000644D96F